MKKLLITFVFMVVILFMGRGSVFSFYCDGEIVSIGDTKAEVIMKCAEPTWKLEQKKEIIKKIDADEKHKTYITIEEWFYNFGSNRFIRILKFKNNELINIKTGGYGYDKNKTFNFNPEKNKIAIGDSAPEVIIKWGEPTYKDKREKERILEINSSEKHKIYITIEEWTYDFGSHQLIRILKFENGKLVDIKTGGYGH